jgi:2-furoyl-CoA dehydrogenase FAD binding subunit
MKPAAFDYLRPEGIEEALAALAREGDEARVLAGGQSLLPMLNMRLAEPRLLVDIGGLDALRRCAIEDGALVVGAGVTQAELLSRPRLDRDLPLLAQALPWVGHYQTRSRGTVCGSLAHADPSAELPLCLVALEGDVVLRSTRGRRRIAARDFFTGTLATARRDDELIEAARFPLRRPGTGHVFREMGLRHGDFALAAVAVVASAERLRIALAGVADRPVAGDWPILSGSALDDALNALAWEAVTAEDHHATAQYRRRLVRTLGREAIAEALQCRN